MARAVNSRWGRATSSALSAGERARSLMLTPSPGGPPGTERLRQRYHMPLDGCSHVVTLGSEPADLTGRTPGPGAGRTRNRTVPSRPGDRGQRRGRGARSPSRSGYRAHAVPRLQPTPQQGQMAVVTVCLDSSQEPACRMSYSLANISASAGIPRCSCPRAPAPATTPTVTAVRRRAAPLRRIPAGLLAAAGRPGD